MNLIEQLGGYEKAKSIRDINIIEFDGDASGVTIHYMGNSITQEDLEKALLEHRRQHNIFEAGDEVVGLASATDELFEIETASNKPNRKGEKTYAVTFVGKEGLLVGLQYRHATDEEIKAGRRL